MTHPSIPKLRLIRTERDAAEELARNAERARKALLAEQRGLSLPGLATCQGMCHVYDGPGGEALPLGGFLLVCVVKKGHPGYCRDATDIGFLPDVQSLHTDRVTRGRVVFWAGLNYDAVLDLERTLTEDMC